MGTNRYGRSKPGIPRAESIGQKAATPEPGGTASAGRRRRWRRETYCRLTLKMFNVETTCHGRRPVAMGASDALVFRALAYSMVITFNVYLVDIN